MQPDDLRAVFVTRQKPDPAGWTGKRVLSWVARGTTLVVLVMIGVAWLEGDKFSRKIDRVAADVAATAGELPSWAESDNFYADLERKIAEIRRGSDEASAYVAIGNGEISTVADWRAATPIAQTVRAEYWLRAAVGGQQHDISDATFRRFGSEIAACVDSLIRTLEGMEESPAVVFGARCIARILG